MDSFCHVQRRTFRRLPWCLGGSKLLPSHGSKKCQSKDRNTAGLLKDDILLDLHCSGGGGIFSGMLLTMMCAFFDSVDKGMVSLLLRGMVAPTVLGSPF